MAGVAALRPFSICLPSLWGMRVYASSEMELSLICLGPAPEVKGPGGISKKPGLLASLQWYPNGFQMA